MEQSKLISMMIAKFKIAYPYFFKDLTNEELLGMISMYQEELSEYDELTLMTVVKSIIRTNKYMPSLKELIDECEKVKIRNRNLIINRMQQDGYFKSLDEVAKAYNFLSTGIIPDWFLKDLKKYGYQSAKQLSNNNLLEGEITK